MEREIRGKRYMKVLCSEQSKREIERQRTYIG
jgi:hypothetical protein